MKSDQSPPPSPDNTSLPGDLTSRIATRNPHIGSSATAGDFQAKTPAIAQVSSSNMESDSKSSVQTDQPAAFIHAERSGAKDSSALGGFSSTAALPWQSEMGVLLSQYPRSDGAGYLAKNLDTKSPVLATGGNFKNIDWPPLHPIETPFEATDYPSIPAAQNESHSQTDNLVDLKNTEELTHAVEESDELAAAHDDQAGITTQIAPAMLPDTETCDEGYAESNNTSYVTSIASEISKGVLENERVYPNYGQHSYGMPIDEDEMDRMDLQHRKYELLLNNKHFLAPIGPTPQRILDLGTGTGIWALDVADIYPSAQVVGVDIAPIQPKWVAPNCQFEIDDVEAWWTYQKESFDFIHFRDPLFCIRDWPKLMRQCYEHLKPGGWCEVACIYPVVMCDDGSMPADSGFKVICEKFMESSAIFGAPTDCPIKFAQYLRNAGFEDVSENIFKIPSSPWPKDKRLKQIGALEMTNVAEGAMAFGLRAFEKAWGWSKEQTELAMVSFRRDVRNQAYHQYCQYFVVYGRKPPDRVDLDMVG